LSIHDDSAVDTIATAVREGNQHGADELETLSYTALSELERCGYRFYLERVLGIAEDRAAARSALRRGLEARARGTLIHRLMEAAEPTGLRRLSPDDVAKAGRELGMRVGEDERVEIAGLIGVAGSVALAGRVAAARSIRREYPFAFSAGPGLPLITGVIDLLASEADGDRLVIDYKSDRVADDVDLEALVEREYGAQRLLYALAVLRAGTASVEIVHWFLGRPREWVSASYTAADRDELERRLAARVRRAAHDVYAVSARPHRELCLTCPGRGGLCSWPEEATLREDPDLREDPSRS
jgi:ATP-dependent helicase/nuclease subunit A